VNAPDPPLTDGVIRLRPFHAGDAAAIASACTDPLIARFIPLIPVPYRLADAEAYLEASRVGDDLNLAISPVEGDELLGAIGLGPAGDDGAAETGYWIAPGHRGQGLATRALRLLSLWAIEELGVPRLQLQTMTDNTASQTVAERAGFTREAVLRRYMSNRGDRCDSVVFSLVPGDL
jgi:RimJ/RimL family protein N-acetyltransferase